MIRQERIEDTLVITLAHPERRNALSLRMMQALTAALRHAGEDRSVAAIVLAADGPVFSSGHDLREMQGTDLDAARTLFAACTELMETVQSVPQPVIAEVQGLATAAGCQLVATCDLAVAADTAGFATPGVRIGLFCSTPMVALSRAIGRKRAMEMLLTGRMVKAAEAEEWGLINRAVPAAELRPAVLELARAIAQASTKTVATGKHAFYTQIEERQHAAYEITREVMSNNALAVDAQEGICAFLEKRQPSWTGR